MTLEKARIDVEYKTGVKRIDVLFNPNSYSMNRSNTINETVERGPKSSNLQYGGSLARTLSMDLFIDTYEQQTDCSQYTEAIFNLLGIDEDEHAPPPSTFRWGQFSFSGYVESVSGRYTLFLPNGAPARATLSVTFRGSMDAKVAARSVQTNSVDRRKIRVVKRGDTLSSIAAAEYDDPGMWRPIAVANGIVDPLGITPGQTLILPPLV